MLRMTATYGLALLALCSCTNISADRRWASMRYGNTEESLAQLRFYAAPAAGASSEPSPLSWLSNEGQPAYIAEIGRRANTLERFRSELVRSPSPRPANRVGQPVSDRVQRLLIATLSRPGSFSPGDRIARAVIYVLPRNFTFGGYSVIQTARQTIDITKLTQSSEVQASLSVSGTPARVAITPEGTIKSTQSTSTETNVQESREVLTMDIEPSCMRIVQEGARNSDITGNIFIQGAIVAEAAPENCSLPEPSGRPDRLTVSNQRLPAVQRLHIVGPELSFQNGRPTLGATETPGVLRTYPDEPLVADILMYYTIRRVTYGLESYIEGKQHVQLLNGIFSDACQVVLDPLQTIPPLYAVLARSQSGTIENVFLKDGDADVLFSDPETARATAAWIKASPRNRSLGTLRIRDTGGMLVSFAIAPPRARSPAPCDRRAPMPSLE